MLLVMYCIPTSLELCQEGMRFVQVEYMILASHLVWAFWSVVRWVTSIVNGLSTIHSSIWRVLWTSVFAWPQSKSTGGPW